MARALIAALALAAAALPVPTAAQALCGGPHGSPVLAQGGATLGGGQGWVQVSAVAQRSTDFFNTQSSRQSFLASGHVRTASLFVTTSVGLLDGFDVWAQLPLHDARFADDGGARDALGLGDPRVAVRLSPRLVTALAIPLTVRLGLKLPGRDFPLDATVIPLSEGQRDVEMSLQSSGGLSVAGAWVLGWVGYRWRDANAVSGRRPGNEWFGHAALGADPGDFRVQLAVDVLAGRTPLQAGAAVPTGQRRLLMVQPTLGYDGLGPGLLEVTLFLPVAGRNLPAGPGLGVGYRIAWGGAGDFDPDALRDLLIGPEQ